METSHALFHDRHALQLLTLHHIEEWIMVSPTILRFIILGILVFIYSAPPGPTILVAGMLQVSSLITFE